MAFHGLDRMKDEFQRLPIVGKVIAGLVCLGLLAVVITLAGIGGNKLAKWNYDRKEAKNQKLIQDALSVAEAKDRQAEAKEIQAAELGKVNEKKASDAAAKQQTIIEEAKNQDAQIRDDFERDKTFINSDLSVCDRCRDVCTRLERLIVSNPDLGAYRCSVDSCLEQCGASAPGPAK